MGLSSRLGVGVMVKDHLSTLYIVSKNSRRRSVSDFVIFYCTPMLISGISWSFSLKISGLAEVLAGVTILTALLFGLLLQVFTMGMGVAENKKYAIGDKLPILIDELRANISYACGVGLFLTLILTGMAAFKPDAAPTMIVLDPGKGVILPPIGGQEAQSNWDTLSTILTAACLGLFAHLMLTLLMILKRLRTTYRLLAK